MLRRRSERVTTQLFDTLAAARELQAAGIGERQAAAIVNAIQGATGDHLATKADLEHLGTRTRAELYRVAIGIVLANAGLTAAIIQLLL